MGQRWVERSYYLRGVCRGIRFRQRRTACGRCPQPQRCFRSGACSVRSHTGHATAQLAAHLWTEALRGSIGPGLATIQEQLAVSKANLSQHVAILKSAGLVTSFRRENRVYCALAFPEIKDACHLARKLVRTQARRERQLEAAWR